jgi:adenylylsulfate kinase
MVKEPEHGGWAIWITGLPGSGKSTLACGLYDNLEKLNVKAELVSSDELRKELTPQPTYSEEERDLLYNCLTFLAIKLVKNNINVIIDATGNRRKYRNKCRHKIKQFAEIYLKCPLGICIQREKKRKNTHFAPKRIYDKAFSQKDTTIPGIGSPYEEPEKPELVLDSNKLSIQDCIKETVNFILDNFEKKFN